MSVHEVQDVFLLKMRVRVDERGTQGTSTDGAQAPCQLQACRSFFFLTEGEVKVVQKQVQVGNLKMSLRSSWRE